MYKSKLEIIFNTLFGEGLGTQFSMHFSIIKKE